MPAPPLRLSVPAWPSIVVSLASLAPDVTFVVDERDLRLTLTVNPDWLGRSVRNLAHEHGIPAQVSVYEGGHGPVGPRASEVMFPFFTEVLETA